LSHGCLKANQGKLLTLTLANRNRWLKIIFLSQYHFIAILCVSVYKPLQRTNFAGLFASFITEFDCDNLLSQLWVLQVTVSVELSSMSSQFPSIHSLVRVWLPPPQLTVQSEKSLHSLHCSSKIVIGTSSKKRRAILSWFS